MTDHEDFNRDPAEADGQVFDAPLADMVRRIAEVVNHQLDDAELNRRLEDVKERARRQDMEACPKGTEEIGHQIRADVDELDAQAPLDAFSSRERAVEVAGVIDGSATIRVSAVPDALRPVAAALCAPLLTGGRLPASYSEIVRRLRDRPTLKQVRSQVDQLRRHYENETSALAPVAAERSKRNEEELAVAEPPLLRGGVWIFPAEVRPTDDPPARRPSRSLPLPAYYEVAHLLVRRRLITKADVDALGEALA